MRREGRTQKATHSKHFQVAVGPKHTGLGLRVSETAAEGQPDGEPSDVRGREGLEAAAQGQRSRMGRGGRRRAQQRGSAEGPEERDFGRDTGAGVSVPAPRFMESKASPGPELKCLVASLAAPPGNRPWSAGGL